MSNLSPQQIKRLERLSQVIDKGPVGIFQYLNELEDIFDKKIEELKASIPDLNKVLESIKGKDGESIQGDPGYTPIKGIDYADGINGENYILTQSDIKDIVKQVAPLVKVPIVEKIIEKTEIIREQPIVKTEIIKDMTETGDDIVSKINDLETLPELQIDAKHIKNLPVSKAGNQGFGRVPIRILNNGTEVSQNVTELNFVNPTSITTPSINGRRVSITTGSGGGGSGFQVPTSGIVNGINKTFVWAIAPNSITVDQGRAMQKVSSDGVSVNWTGTTTTVLTVEPGFDIFSTA